jgi:hypothetical protein
MAITEYGGDGMVQGIVTRGRWQVGTARPDLTAATSAILEELQPEYLDVLPVTVIAQCVDQALSDLSGSICVEALPEMAIRLTRFRLDAQRG